MNKNSEIKSVIEHADAAKKVNPLDLSSDQDLTIAVMNLIAIEDMACGDVADAVGEMRAALLGRIVPVEKNMDLSVGLLGTAMRLIESGNRAADLGDMETAYRVYDEAYSAYSLFWGLNMGFVSADDIKISEIGVN
jgi:hypothetical protein